MRSGSVSTNRPHPTGCSSGPTGSEKAGYCWVTTSGIEAEVTSFGIDDRAAGTGLAASLVARGLQWAEIQGAYTAVVHIGEEDHKAARLFRRLGFMIEPDRPS